MRKKIYSNNITIEEPIYKLSRGSYKLVLVETKKNNLYL